MLSDIADCFEAIFSVFGSTGANPVPKEMPRRTSYRSFSFACGDQVWLALGDCVIRKAIDNIPRFR
jgi:hypothetical protein